MRVNAAGGARFGNESASFTSWGGSPHASRLTPALVASVVVAVTAVAFWIRIQGLQGWDGTLTVDEARLALAARGVLATGLPRLPSGWIYTRGLLVTYLTAPSLALLGETDFAARLPAVLTGAALIPVAYALGREAAGRLGGLFVATLLAGHPSFVVWSRQAWFYALYVLLFAAAMLVILRARRTGRLGDQLLAAVFTGLSLYTHEVGVFLLAPLVAQVILRLRSERGRPGAWLAAIASLAIVGTATILLWLLITRLRAESLVGAYGEIDEYLSPAFEWSRVGFYLRLMADRAGLLPLAALAGLLIACRQRRADTLLLWLGLIPTFLHAAFLIPRGPQERYGLTLILAISVLAAQGVTLVASSTTHRVGRRRSQLAVSPDMIVAIAFGAMLLAHQDIGGAIQRAALSPGEGSWLRQARQLGIDRDTIVITDLPTTVAWYIGGVDYWISSRDFQKYTTRQGDIRCDVHTGAILVRNRPDFELLVSKPQVSRDVWIIASGRSYQWGELVDDDLKAFLERSAQLRVNPGGNFRLLLVRPPSGS
jgi:4-amino-4-deoxy-L-arabinose transferase-like glycosyltransferase